ncbi:MAG: threonine aldolase [Alphaproteobacteria bacterium PA2]|nr:MAG: threonine aldolase [Alphaproteobacteria bacterium PA2]
MPSDDQRLHGHLIGRQGSRRDLNTPVLVVELAALEANIATMAALVKRHGVDLRPHAKTHKSVDIARLQIAAGAVGLCCAKLGEAEALAAGGITGLHITSPVVTPQAISRLVALQAQSPDLSVVVDNLLNIAALNAAASAPLTVLVDIDPGLHRTGVASPDEAVAAARAISQADHLVYGGIQFYCGREQHILGYAERRTAMETRTAYLQSVIRALEGAGLSPPIITGSGTGTHQIDLELGVFTELQAGSYVFMDDQYRACDLTGEGAEAPRFQSSLFVDASVVSANSKGLVTVDAGLKAFATEGDPPRPTGVNARYAFMGDEHGALVAECIENELPLGAPVRLTIPHCDPTVDRFDSYHLLEGDTLKDIWPVSARGRSR